MKSASMRRAILVVGVIVAICMSGGVSERWFRYALAAPEAAPPKGAATSLAVVDVAFVFKNFKPFNDEMATLLQEVQASQQQLAASQAQIDILKARAEQTKDKVEREKLEVELATQTTELQLATRKSQNEAFEAEEKLYYDTYTLLQEEIKKICRARGIHIALKTNREPINAEDRNSIMQGMARPIVFSDAPDISNDVLKAVDVAAAEKAARAKP